VCARRPIVAVEVVVVVVVTVVIVAAITVNFVITGRRGRRPRNSLLDDLRRGLPPVLVDRSTSSSSSSLGAAASGSLWYADLTPVHLGRLPPDILLSACNDKD
jgi:hypothetical protein